MVPLRAPCSKKRVAGRRVRASVGDGKNKTRRAASVKSLETFSPRPAVAHGLLILAAFMWAASTVIARGVHAEIPPIGLSFWRAAIAVVVLLPLVWRALGRKRALIMANWKLLWLLGVMQVGASALLIVAVNYTGAINATLVNAAQPALTAVVAWVLIGDRVSRVQGLGIAGALAGIVVMTARADWRVLVGFDFNVGDLLVVGAILGWAIYATQLPRLPRELGMTTMLFVITLAGAVSLIPFYVFETAFVRPMPISLTALVTVVVLGIIVTVFSVFIWNAGIRAIGPNRAVVFINLIPVFGAALAIVFLGERLYFYHLIGALFVFAGIMAVIRDKPKTEAAAID
jgi:drug/metabolite transporter (DMT)-like permease